LKTLVLNLRYNSLIIQFSLKKDKSLMLQALVNIYYLSYNSISGVKIIPQRF
jgi:hypothetical protein